MSGLSVKCCCASFVIKLSERSSDREGDAPVVGHGEMADSVHGDVSYVEVRMVQSGIAAGHDEVVDVTVKCNEPGAAAGCRLGELLDHR